MYRNTIEIELKNIEPRLVLVPRKVVDKVVLHQLKLPAILGLISSQFSSIDSIWTDFETINSLNIMKFADLIKTILHNSFIPFTVLLFLKKL